MTREHVEPRPRDPVIHKVRIGEIAPEEAVAERQGFGPLATKPNPVDFDPSRMLDWSLPMALDPGMSQPLTGGNLSALADTNLGRCDNRRQGN